MSVNDEKLKEEQTAEYGQYIDYITDDKVPIPDRETISTMSYYSLQDGLLFKYYLPRHLRKQGTFRD